ncbi:RHS repeat-associated core domain-containing protein [Methanosarcina sp. 2.H.T.1A.6]|uniref:RHS repeat-associated core domain-containing protein n=1 Tax=Methanosarcina sp. 2.H.T.1A.6 TaxID=1483599 RepID=UPI0021014621|nr:MULTISPECIES: RHS repeat-associated core domain-containing protein [unclassified Methanosarcina]
MDKNGLEVERTDYFPYGQVRSGGLEKYGFTGQENDADTGLMYYGARYYSPGYRVFVQPDTLLPDPYNPQALNRYSYALNNPVKYTDPSGHYVETAIDIAFLAMDINDIRTGNADKWTYIGLATDVACAVVPGVTGGRLGVQALEETVTHGDELADFFNLMDKTAGVEKKVDNAIDAEKTVNHIDDTLQATDYVLKANTKAEAKKAVDGLPLEIRDKIKDFYNGGSNKYTEFTLQKTENGYYVATMTKPGNVPGSYATYYKEISPSGETLKVYKETIDPSGNLVHSKNKMG